MLKIRTGIGDPELRRGSLLGVLSAGLNTIPPLLLSESLKDLVRASQAKRQSIDVRMCEAGPY